MNSALARNLATLFGIGFVKPASGTVASIVSVPIAALIVWACGGASAGRGVLLLCGLAAFAIGAVACDVYARETGKTDPSECVIDELAGQWIACAFAPLNFWAYAVAFIAFRALDIAKPWPIRRLEKLHGGFGIMADDVAAGLIAGFIVAALTHWGLL